MEVVHDVDHRVEDVLEVEFHRGSRSVVVVVLEQCILLSVDHVEELRIFRSTNTVNSLEVY